MEKFAEIVKEKSGGKIDVKLFPGGVLGGDVQTVSSLQGGVVEMLVLNAGILASNVKAFGAVDLPFLFNSGEEADKIMDGPSARACPTSCRIPASLVLPIGNSASAISPTTAIRSPSSRKSRA